MSKYSFNIQKFAESVGQDIVQGAQAGLAAAVPKAKPALQQKVNDYTNIRNGLEKHVDEEVRLVPGANPDATKKMLMGTASVESNYGINPKANGNVFQLDPAALNEIQSNRHPKLNELKSHILKQTGIDINNTPQSKLTSDPRYSALSARLYYAINPAPIPDTRAGRAAMWKSNYNTGAGKGTINAYLQRTNPTLSQAAPVPAAVQQNGLPAPIPKVAYALQPYQERVLDKLDNTDALLVWHGMGSGKSLGALAAGEKFKRPVSIVGPAALRETFPREKEKWKTKQDINVSTYNKPANIKNSILVFDEAHRMGGEGTERSTLPEKMRGYKTLFMTGTPIRNRPDELIPLMKGLGITQYTNPKAFNEHFIEPADTNRTWLKGLIGSNGPAEPEIRNKSDLVNLFKGKVDYHENTHEGYPSVEESDIQVEMTPEQVAAYKMAMRGSPDLAYKIRHGIAPNKSESTRMNAFLSAPRQISNTPVDYNTSAKDTDAPKINRAVAEIQKRLGTDKNYRGVTYSTYLGHGLLPLAAALKSHNIKYGLFTGEEPIKQKKQVIDDYNKGNLKQLLISGAGAEGLDLKGTKLMQILEPHWNDPLLDQVKARAIRYMSHAALPENERNVEVQNYESILPETGYLWWKGREKSSDEYMDELAAKKARLNNQFLTALQEASDEV